MDKYYIIDENSSDTTKYVDDEISNNVNSKINIIEYIIKNDYDNFCYNYNKVDENDIFDAVICIIKFKYDIKYFKYIMDQGFDVNKSKHEMTLLGYAILEENKIIEEILISEALRYSNFKNKLVIGNVSLTHLLSLSDRGRMNLFRKKLDPIPEEKINYLLSYLHHDRKKLNKLFDNFDNNYTDVVSTPILILKNGFLAAYYPLKLINLCTFRCTVPVICCCLCCVAPSVATYKCLSDHNPCYKKEKEINASHEFRKKYGYARRKNKIKSKDLIEKYEEIKYTPDNYGNIFSEIKFNADNDDFNINKFIISKPKLKLLFNIYDEKSYIKAIKKYDL